MPNTELELQDKKDEHYVQGELTMVIPKDDRPPEAIMMLFTKRGYLIEAVEVPAEIQDLLVNASKNKLDNVADIPEEVASWVTETTATKSEAFWQRWESEPEVCPGDVPIRVFGRWISSTPKEVTLSLFTIFLTIILLFLMIFFPGISTYVPFKVALFIATATAIGLISYRLIKLISKNIDDDTFIP